MKSILNYRLSLICVFCLSLFSCQEGTTTTEPPYEGPPKGHIITVERAQEMYDSYSERRVSIIKKYEDSIKPTPESFGATRYAEFDLATFKQYIAFIEHEANRAKVDVSTLRFYLSNYPNSNNYPNGDAVKYPRQNSIFVVPTMDHNGENVGFSIEELEGKYSAVPIRKRDGGNNDNNGVVNEAGFLSSNTTTLQVNTTSLILNDGTIMPPPILGSNDFGDNN